MIKQEEDIIVGTRGTLLSMLLWGQQWGQPLKVEF